MNACTARALGRGWLRGCGLAVGLAVGLVVVLALLAPQVRGEDEPAEKPAAYTPKVLGVPLKDLADKALGEGKHAEAIALYLRWLEADPRDGNGRYNLACAYALSGEKDKALTAFETAIDAGFKDTGHAQRDSDLKSLQTAPRFKAAIARAEAKAAAGELPRMRRHLLTATTIGTYIVLLPPDYAKTKKRYPVVFILHGSGSSEIGHARVAEAMGREDVIYVAPRALHPHHGVFLGGRNPGWTAWPTDQPAKGDDASEPMALYAGWIARCADDVAKRYRVHGSKVFVWGHSQGAAAANVFAALHPKRVASYFAYAGYYPEAITDATIAGLKTNGVHVELCHGIKDPVVPSAPTRDMGARLEKAGVSRAVHLVEAGHSLTEEVHSLSKAWADKRARGSLTKVK